MVRLKFKQILAKKRRRDIFRNLSQFVVIFLMVFLGMFVFAGVRGYMDGMQVAADRFYEESNLADIWLDGRLWLKEDVVKIQQIEGVNKVERLLRRRMGIFNRQEVALEVNFLEGNEISKIKTVEGVEFDAGDKEGLWLDKYLADNLGYRVGDELTLEDQGRKMRLIVKGLVFSPEYVYATKDVGQIVPTHTDFGFGFVSAKNLSVPMFSRILVDVEKGRVQEVKQEIEKKYKKAVATTREEQISYVGYKGEIEEGRTYSAIFTALFLLIAVLSVVSTMHRFVDGERTQIGVMKALGFSDWRIVKFYVGYSFYLSVMAVILGIVLGQRTIGSFFLEEEMKIFEMPEYRVEMNIIVLVLAILMVILITLVNYLACRKILRQSASEALRKEPPKIKLKKFRIFDLKILGKMNTNVKWNLRDISRNKGRSLTGVAGVAGACVLVVCAFGMKDSMLGYIDWQFELISNFSHKLKLAENISENDFLAIKNKYGEATTMEFGVEVFEKEGGKKTNLIVNDAKGVVRYTDHNLKLMEIGEKGAYLTEKLAVSLKKKVGEKIKWRKFGEEKWREVVIEGLVRDPENQVINMSRAAVEEMGIKYVPNYLYVKKGEDRQVVKEVGVEEVKSLSLMRKAVDEMLAVIDKMIIIMAITSVILGMVVVYDLGALSFVEKKYQFATMKVLGFKNRQIRKIFVTQNIWLSLVAIVVGLPLGYVMTEIIFVNGIGDRYDFEARIRIWTYVGAAIGVMVVTLVVNYLLAKKIKKIDMVESLKMAE